MPHAACSCSREYLVLVTFWPCCFQLVMLFAIICIPGGNAHCHELLTEWTPTGSAGLPVGLQLIGQPWQEAALLYVSSALEAAIALQADQRAPKVCTRSMLL